MPARSVKRKNKVLEAFESELDEDEDISDTELSEDDIEAEADGDAIGFTGDADADEFTDEDVEEEIARLDEQRLHLMERSRKKGRSSTRGSREERKGRPQAREVTRVDAEREVDWQPANTLDAPPPRAGMEQRWIRFQLSENNDPKNWSRKMRERWAPRRLDTVDGSFMPPTIEHSKLGELIGIGDLILCERPASIGAARRKYFAAKQRRQVAAAERRAVNRVEDDDHPIRSSSKRSLTRGRGRRKVRAQDD